MLAASPHLCSPLPGKLASAALALLAWGLLSCTSGAPAADQTSPSASRVEAPAPSPVTSTAEPLDARQRLMQETLARAREIQDEVAALRGLTFSHPVPAKQQTTAEFRVAMITELEKYLPAAKSTKTSKALFHVGLLKTKMDLATALIEIAVGQVAAYYNPETGTFYAVTLSDNPTWLEVMTAHELVHGLQDQNFDLRRYVGEPSPNNPTKIELSEDELNARRFVVEGEATMLMWMHMFAKQSGEMSPTADVLKNTRGAIAMMNGQTWQDMVAAADLEAKQSKTKKAAKLSAMPPFLVAPTLEAYTRGARTAFAVHQAGGWKAVNELYANPPQSTEQVLHPVEKLATKRDIPTRVTVPAINGLTGEPLVSETFGELGWRVYFQTWDIPAAEVSAAGWDGDKVLVYETASGLVALMAFVWDSEDDAIEFENAFRRSARVRTNRGAEGTKGASPIARYKRADTGEIVIVRDGDKVFVVDGAEGKRADELLLKLKTATTFTSP